MQKQIDPLGMEVRQEAQQVRKGPTKPIYRPSSHYIDLTPRNSGHQSVETGPSVATLGTRHTCVLIRRHNVPPVPLCDRVKLPALVAGRLFAGGDAEL